MNNSGTNNTKTGFQPTGLHWIVLDSLMNELGLPDTDYECDKEFGRYQDEVKQAESSVGHLAINSKAIMTLPVF